MDQLLTVADAARILTLSPWTIRSYVRCGKLHPLRLGRRLAFEQSDLQRLVDEARSLTSTQQSSGESQQ